MVKTCTECKLDKLENDFAISRKSGYVTWRTPKCRDCLRGHVLGFAGKLTDTDKENLRKYKNEFATMKPADFYRLCGLNITLQSFYRYIRLGQVAEFLAE